jgi:fatty-acyl-CoA synthase
VSRRSRATTITLGDEYEQLLANVEPDTSPVTAAEGDALALCYTSGTTADPKGVLFSHRSAVLHALGLLMVDSHAIGRADVVMPVTGLFHVLGWGLPYAVALAGGDLVLPGHSNAPADLARLIASHGVTKGAAVPTVWNDFLPQFDDHELPSLRELLIGAAMPLVELRLVDENGSELPWDGEAAGELQARGPHVAAAYYKGKPFADGWLRTGDLATIDPDGTVHLVDRAKDLVKSGGGWISSAQLENTIAAHPGVHEAAVIAVPDERWGDRPLALVSGDGDVTADAIRDFLRLHVAKWWIPERIEFVEAIPRTAVGKYDKRALRESYRA